MGQLSKEELVVEERMLELFKLEMSKLRLLQIAQQEERDVVRKKEEERTKKDEEERLQEQWKALVEKRSREEIDETLQLNHMKDVVKEMQETAKSSEMTPAMAGVTKVLAAYQSKYLICNI